MNLKTRFSLFRLICNFTPPPPKKPNLKQFKSYAAKTKVGLLHMEAAIN